ncbi:Post-SET domain-containing protein [Cynara cardunculus var. scolymus]|uniref:Post-SET domain-containing protein n=1 Tax=Cynara cardunculus var. scolymus TaxID=59895 RepID=A0A103XVW1_CYNCS|nr:Post-SET domain-containing protein [Cynara cardunculus var. scolymus]
MLECNEVLFPIKRFGHLPGIDVGYQFYSRAEMVAVGLHSHWLNDIDYMGQSYRKMEEFKGCTFPLAVAIILSGQNEDDLDNSEDVVYTGQGGNNFMGNKHQEMSCGNLALKNSMEQATPVRVVRGHTGGHHSFRLYTYDGLYKVSECWPADGFSGFVADKYRLKRLEGQPKLTRNQVQYSNGRSSRIPIKSPQLVCLDVAEGQEDVYIPAINTIDDATITGFTYTKYNQVASNLNLPPTAGGCECKGNCTNPKTCACARLNGFDFPYVRSNGGRLIEPKDVVFECGPNCGCGPGCINRISQQGIKYQLEVFRTSDRGWAVKTKDFIPSGAPVCEYIGELRRTNELDNVAENDYIFEIDCWQTMKGIGGREPELMGEDMQWPNDEEENLRRLGDVSESVSNELDDQGGLPEAEFCIDAGCVGNVARFINHSCDPNLFVQCVLSWHHDVKLARVVLFACDNIPPMQELTYDYGYELDSVVDNNGSVRMLPCHCGTSECRKRLY